MVGMAAAAFVAVAIAHVAAVEVMEVAMVVEMLIMARIGTAISVARIKVMVYMTVEIGAAWYQGPAPMNTPLENHSGP
jgi:hypothetical protein